MRYNQKMNIQFGEAFQPRKPEYIGDVPFTLEEFFDMSGGSIRSDIKYDGYCTVAHVNGSDIHLFSYEANRMGNDRFPEIVQALQRLELKDTILHGELLGKQVGHGAFKAISRRASVGLDKVEERMQEFPLRYVGFNVLMTEGEIIADLPYKERREVLEDILPNNDLLRKSNGVYHRSIESFDTWFKNEIIKPKREGTVLYNPNGLEMIKKKRYETLDLAVVGLYQNDGRFASSEKYPYTGALCAIRTADGFLPFVRVNLARDDPNSDLSFYEQIADKLEIIDDKAANVQTAKKKNLLPSVHVKPTTVLEVNCMNITKDKSGLYSARIAHVERVREKTIEMASPFSLLEAIFKEQEKLTGQAEKW